MIKDFLIKWTIIWFCKHSKDTGVLFPIRLLKNNSTKTYIIEFQNISFNNDLNKIIKYICSIEKEVHVLRYILCLLFSYKKLDYYIDNMLNDFGKQWYNKTYTDCDFDWFKTVKLNNIKNSTEIYKFNT